VHEAINAGDTIIGRCCVWVSLGDENL